MESQFSAIINNPILKMGFLIISSLILAKISDVFFSFLIKKIVLKTKSDIDDKIVNYLHKPIYYSILFICLTLSLQVVDNKIPDSIDYILLGCFKSITIALWSFALFNILILIIKWYSQRNKENNLFNKNALPLFDNLGKIIIFLGAIYFIFLRIDDSKSPDIFSLF